MVLHESAQDMHQFAAVDRGLLRHEASNAVRIHPRGISCFPASVEIEIAKDIVVRRAMLLRTARKLMRGDVFVPGAIWSRK